MANMIESLWGIRAVIMYGWAGILLGVSGSVTAAESVDVSKALKIQGDYLSSATEVQINGKSVAFKILSDQEIAIAPPLLTDKPIRISVVTPAGAIGFDYVPPQETKVTVAPLEIRSISPVQGSSLGGAVAVLQGANFKNQKYLAVTFGGVMATDLHVNSDGVLTVNVPPHGPGLVDIEVKGGANVATLKKAFDYVSPPQITSVSPISGPVTGGTKIMISGACFAAKGVRVMLGRAEASEVKVKDGGNLEVVAPPYTEGATDVTVINPDGQQGQSKEAFLYVPIPTIRGVTPAQ